MRKLATLIVALVLAVASCGGNDSSGENGARDAAPVQLGPPDAGNGAKIYDSTCVACHGQGGSGITGLGKPMPDSDFIAGLSDTELALFIEEGRSTDHEDNTTGVEMPARGGNDKLSEQDIVDVVAFIRSL